MTIDEMFDESEVGIEGFLAQTRKGHHVGRQWNRSLRGGHWQMVASLRRLLQVELLCTDTFALRRMLCLPARLVDLGTFVALVDLHLVQNSRIGCRRMTGEDVIAQ